MDNSRIGFCAFENAGHTWAGSNYGDVCKDEKKLICKKYKDIIGEINNDINLMDLYWGFFNSMVKNEKK